MKGETAAACLLGSVMRDQNGAIPMDAHLVKKKIRSVLF